VTRLQAARAGVRISAGTVFLFSTPTTLVIKATEHSVQCLKGLQRPVCEVQYSPPCTRWFKYDRDDLCVNKSQFVPVIFEPPCTSAVNNAWISASIPHYIVLALCLTRHGQNVLYSKSIFHIYILSSVYRSYLAATYRSTLVIRLHKRSKVRPRTGQVPEGNSGIALKMGAAKETQ
jgi:hypothetical protein